MPDGLALFDFDGTLTTKDSLLDFIAYAVGWPRTVWGAVCLAPLLARYKMGWADNGAAKQQVIAHFFGGISSQAMADIGQRYARRRLPDILSSQATEKLRWHQAQGHDVVVVTASIEDWLSGWTDQIGVGLIATKLQQGETITGAFATKNCYGPEKVRRIKRQLDLSAYDTIYAYGDTEGDRPMLELADHAFYRSFKD